MKVPNSYGVDNYVNQEIQAIHAITNPFKASNKEAEYHYADWLAAHKAGAYNSDTGESGKKKKISHDEFAKQLQVKLVNGFSKATVEYNAPLTTFMTYWDVKVLLTETLGYSHWNEVPMKVRKLIITGSQMFPDWDSIERPDY